MRFIKHRDIEMLSFESLDSFDDIFNFVTTRNGAIDGDPYSSFNLGMHSGEAVDKVLEHQETLRKTIGIASGRFILPRQIHGNGVAVIDETFLGLSSDGRKNAVSRADALITNIPMVCIGITTADCVPVLLFDPVKKAVGVAHAGWRGTVQHIVSATVYNMVVRFGTSPADIYAAIGPSIGQEQFEVGDEVYEAFRDAYTEIERLSMRHPVTGKYHIDLWEANRADLYDAGILSEHIEVAGLCTRTRNDLFFSARDLGVKSGRFISGIYLK
ncbi:peptidoglycan editing factor PgeF [Coprobacter sp.]